MRQATYLVFLCLLPFSVTYSQAAADSAEGMDAVGEYTDETLEPIDLVYGDVSQQLEDYMNGPVAAKFNSPGTHLEQGIATVDVSTSHRDWAKHRVLAYKSAWANVQENFIRYQMNETSTEMVRKLYADASGNVPDYEPGSYTGNNAIDEFIDKSGAYTSGKLDAALAELGVNPDEYSRGTNEQRTKLLESAIRQETITRSVGKLTGLWPLMSFTGTVDDRHAVGVVGIYRPVFEEVAAEIATGRIPQATNKRGRPISERVSSNKAELSNSFGVRLVRDENGYPALISFGQWSVTSTNTNPSIRAKFRDVAIKQARSQADAELALFLNGSANFTDRSVVGSVVEEYVDVNRDGYNAAGSSTTIEDMIDQVLKARGRAKLSGLRDLRTWVYKHPSTGHQMVGVVRVWTPVDAMAAGAIRSGPKAEASESTESSATAVEEDSEMRRESAESPAYADPDEF